MRTTERWGARRSQSRNNKGIDGVVSGKQELDSPWASTKARKTVARLRLCRVASRLFREAGSPGPSSALAQQGAGGGRAKKRRASQLVR